MSEAILPQVKNIVFLMLENRSFDNLLGWLYTDSPPPQNFWPPQSKKVYDGLLPGQFSNPDSNGKPVNVIPISDAIWKTGYAIPYRDPYEALRAGNSEDPRDPGDNWYGVMNQFFGDQQLINNLPPPPSGAPKMKGFLQDYLSFSDGTWEGHDILWTYLRNQAPVINTLARKHAVSDRWFCSVPSETNPNRAYSICGTSLGRESNLHWNAKEQFPAKTIFNWLAEAKPPKSWGLYFTDPWVGSQPYTQYTFPQISPKAGEIAPMQTFYDKAKTGKLPAFSYLEPTWTSLTTDGTDYHPNSHIFPGENFLARVYGAVVGGPQYKRNETLFIITFDEHGGTYDHVAPPWGAINPDGKNGIENGFKFNLFGARVPTIFVSPFVPSSTVFRAPQGSIFPFDHTSFIATILKWAGVTPTAAAQGKRVLSAPTFEGVFTNNVVNTETLTAEQLLPSPIAPAPPRQVHPAGSATELNALLKGIPVVPTRVILSRNKTLEGIQAEAARYRQDPEKFEALLDT
jgi:phospholipase C